MAQYIVLLNGSPTSSTELSPTEIQSIIEKYSAWRSKLVEQDRFVSGHKLKDNSGRVLTASGGKVSVVDGPFSEAKEVLGGFFIIQAESYEQAAEICRTCPHLNYGGSIELREIER